jgi:hypothetical protein
MTNLFWVITVTMGVLALLFVLRPLMAGKSRLPGAAIVVAVLIPGLALGLYTYLGRPAAAGSAPDKADHSGRMVASAQDPAEKKVDSVGNLLQGLEDRLEREPDDAGGWLLLSKSYQHLGRIDDAKKAYGKAAALGRTDPAFAEILAGGSSVSPATEQPAASQSVIKGRVSMDAKLAADISPKATVFVFAKAVNGSPMPLAVVRKSVAELPFEFVLDDSLAMAAGMTLSSAPEVVVTAKISSTGNAMQPDAGLEASSGPVEVAKAGYLDLQITKQN